MRLPYRWEFLGLAAWLVLLAAPVLAQMPMRPPAFQGGVPGFVQMQSIALQRHQARTLLYREALEILKKNPEAADVSECVPSHNAPGDLCIRMPAATVAPERIVTRRIAVLFGNNAYRSPIPALDTPIADVQDIGRVLQERFGFEVRVVPDATKAVVVAELNRIAAQTGPDDSVLLFYAGHGYLLESNNMGYWIPVDGSTKSPENWISNTDISKFLKNISARQLILISDSCFSGSLTREQKIPTSQSKSTAPNQSQRAVLVMTSGGEEPVSDEGKEGHSIFAWSLINALKTSTSKTSGVDIFRVVKVEVNKEFSQVPQYGSVFTAGHEDGSEYWFEPPAK